MSSKKRSRRLGCCLFPTVLVLVVGLWLGFKAFRLLGITQSLQANVEKAQALAPQGTGLAGIDTDQAETIILDLRGDVVDLKDETASLMWMTPYLTWLPRVGPLMTDVPALIELADAGSSAAVGVLPVLEPAVDLFANGGGETGTLNQLTGILASAQPQFATVEGDVRRVQDAYGSLQNPDALPWQARQLLPLADTLVPLADDGVRLAQILPAMMGADRPKTYIIIAQNEDELRPTGGYISGVGLLTIDNGQIGALEFASADILERGVDFSIYDFPPEPYLRFMNLQYFLFRDSNFWADFPVSAETAIDLYTKTIPDSPPPDGIIAIDQRFVQLILSAVGPLEVEGFERRVNQNNVINLIRDSWGTGSEEQVTREWWLQRKSFMGNLARAAQDRLLGDPSSIDLTSLMNVIFEATSGKHLQLFMLDESVQAVLADLRWDGAMLRDPAADTLFVVDTNMGYNKSNAITTRSIDYTVNLEMADSPQASTTIVYDHGGESAETCELTRYGGELQYADLIDRCFWNYQRLYVPEGASLNSASDHFAPGEWFVTGIPHTYQAATITDLDGFTTFENFVVAQPGETTIMRYDYQLPTTVLGSEESKTTYKLHVLKQAGSPAESVSVNLILPSSAGAVTASPQPASISGNMLIFEIELSADTTIEIAYE